MTPAEIKQLRLDMGRSQAQMAKVLSVSRATINRWETAETQPLPLSLRVLKQLYKYTHGVDYASTESSTV